MAKSTTDPTERFFEVVAAYGYAPLLRKADGTTRFEIVDGKRTSRWFVTVAKGHITVSRRGAVEPDCAIRVDKALFDRIASGKVNAVAAVLRGDMAIEGDWRLLVWMQRLFPGQRPPRRARAAGYARRGG
jgi:SCP-2 sterol transfer family protein